MEDVPTISDTGMKAICEIKRSLRLQPDHVLVIKDEADTPLAPIWPQFEDMLGSLLQFLRTRPDQFLVKEDPEGPGYSVKDVTGNATVAPTPRAISNTPAPPRRLLRTTESPGGLAKRILGGVLGPFSTDMRNCRGHGPFPRHHVEAKSRRRSRSRSRSRQPRSRHPRRGSGGSGGLRQVLGNWVDTRGSRYQVRLDERGSSCTVKTKRPDGVVRQTNALIRLLPLGGLLWGDSYVLDQGKQPEGQLRWLRLGRASGHVDYVWNRA